MSTSIAASVDDLHCFIVFFSVISAISNFSLHLFVYFFAVTDSLPSHITSKETMTPDTSIAELNGCPNYQ